MTNQKSKEPLRFIIIFLVLFLLFYYFNIMYLSFTSQGNHHIPFLTNHLNYIAGIRWVLISCSVKILSALGYTVVSNTDEILVAGRGFIRVAYSCLGLGVISFFTAFTIAYPKALKSKVIFTICGILGIQLLNVVRFVLLALYWDNRKNQIVDHHTLFNIFIYVAIAVALYFWIKTDSPKTNAAN